VEVPKGLVEQRKLLTTITVVHEIENDDEDDDDDDDEGDSKDNFEQTPIEKCSDYVTSLSTQDATKLFVSVSKTFSFFC
jgi:hypothetical protein